MNPQGEHSEEPLAEPSPGKGTETHAGQRKAASSPGSGGGADEKGPGSNPVSRLAGESRALFEDLREWVDLRVQLVQVDVEERIEKAANEIISVVMVVVLGLFALAFLLHGLAIWIGAALGATQWGYLVVAGVLGLTTLALKTAKPDFMRRRKDSLQHDASLPESPAPKAQLPQSATVDFEQADDKKEGEDHG